MKSRETRRMKDEYRVLLVSENEEFASQARARLSGTQPAAIVQRLNDPAMASARLGGGDVNLLLIDPALLGDGLRRWVDRLPPIATILTTGAWTSELARVGNADAREDARRGANTPKWIGFLG